MVKTINLISALVFLLRREGIAQAATALVPAYIYPLNDATWQPLYSQ